MAAKKTVKIKQIGSPIRRLEWQVILQVVFMI